MADKKPDQDVIRAEVAPPDPAWLGGFHSGAHPQRPIPADATEAEQRMLDRERQQLHADVPPPTEPEPVAPGTGLPLANPKRPRQGLLYVGPTAAEETALRTGRSVKESEELLEAPRKRVAEHHAKQRKES